MILDADCGSRVDTFPSNSTQFRSADSFRGLHKAEVKVGSQNAEIFHAARCQQTCMFLRLNVPASKFSKVGCNCVIRFSRGKGDYFRLGHGTDDHVRRPKKVAALQGKKVIAIATGSLHCVACTDAGEVFTWGDNDEGQLGDGTTNAIQKPRLVTALQVKWGTRAAHT